MLLRKATLAARYARNEWPLQVLEPLLDRLLPDLLWLVFDALEDPWDRVAICIAMPRVGVEVLQQLPKYRDDPLVAVAFALRERCVSCVINEHMLRRYVQNAAATPEGCAWLKAAAMARGCTLHVHVEAGEAPHRYESWRMRDGGDAEVVSIGAQLRLDRQFPDDGTWRRDYYAGEIAHRERLIKSEFSYNGKVCLYEGVRGAEHKVCIVRKGVTYHFAGREEYMVRITFPNGQVKHYEGARNREYVVRIEFPCGANQYYEGARGEEHLVRAKGPRIENGVRHFEGTRKKEHLVRVEFACGTVQHYEGAKGEERVVRVEFARGTVQHYEGARGSERLVRLEFVSSAIKRVEYYEGACGSERLVSG